MKRAGRTEPIRWGEPSFPGEEEPRVYVVPGYSRPGDEKEARRAAALHSSGSAAPPTSGRTKSGSPPHWPIFVPTVCCLPWARRAPTPAGCGGR